MTFLDQFKKFMHTNDSYQKGSSENNILLPFDLEFTVHKEIVDVINKKFSFNFCENVTRIQYFIKRNKLLITSTSELCKDRTFTIKISAFKRSLSELLDLIMIHKSSIK